MKIENRVRIILAGFAIMLGFIIAMLIFSNNANAGAINLNNGAVSPNEGTSSTIFKYTVLYYNTNNKPPTSIIVRIDMDAGHVMLPDPTASDLYRDGDYTNGEQYYNMSTLSSGNHIFSFEAVNGTDSDIYGPISGPVVNDPPQLMSAGVTPSPGKSTDLYKFEVVYKDPDGDVPTLTILIKGSSGQNVYPVTEHNGAPIQSGRKYYYNTTLAPGSYQFNFTANDGKFTVSLPLSNGPIVNHVPTLTLGSVTPTMGTTATNYNYTVVYTDADGDVPMEIFVVIDGVQYAMNPYNSSSPQEGRLYFFNTTSIPSGLGEGAHTFTFRAKDNPIGESAVEPPLQNYPIVNYKPQLSLATLTASKNAVGGIYPSDTVFNFSVSYRDNDNTNPVYIRVYIGGIPYEMKEVDPADQVYSDGKLYYYSSSINAGDVEYYFATSDGKEGCATAPSIIRVNALPTLSTSVSPSYGIGTTNFKFTVTVTDINGQLPNEVKLYIDDNSTGIPMVEEDPLDVNIIDGKVYSYTTIMLPGYHTYRVMVNDSIDVVNVISTGPRVNHAPTLSNSIVTPSSGNISTVFNYTVTYTDMDNTAPVYIRLILDGTNVYNMLPSNSSDLFFADGKDYYYSISGLSAVTHTYKFEAYDGQEYVESALREGPEILIYNVNIAPYYGVDEDVHLYMEQGNVTTFELMIENLGTADDVYTLTAGGDNPQYVSGLPSTISLDPTEIARFNITITIQITESPTEHSFTIKVTSNRDPAVPKASDTIRFVIHVKPVHNIKVSYIGVNESAVDTGTITSYKFRVENLGNVGEFVWINFTGIYSSWAVPIDPNPAAFAAFGAPGYYHDYYLNISIPVGANPETFTTIANISIQNYEYRSYSLFFKTTIKPTYHVNLTYITPEYNYTADPWSVLNVNFYLENVGTIQDSYTIAISTSEANWTISAVSDISNVAIYEVRTVTLSINIPANSLVGWHNVKIIVTSVGNNSVNGTLNIRVNVTQVHSFNIVQSLIVINVTPGGSISVSFNVTNLGNGLEEINLYPYGYPPMLSPTLTPSKIYVEPLQTSTVTLTISVDGGAAPGEVAFLINGTCSEQSVVDTMSVIVNVSKVYNMLVSSSSYTNTTLPGGSAGFSITVKNTGNCEETFKISWDFPSALSSSITTTMITISPGNSTTVSFMINADMNAAGGNYKIYVNVTSLSKPSVNTSKEYTLTVKQVYQVDAQYIDGTTTKQIEVSSGQTYDVQIKIWNYGNGVDTIKFTCTGSNAWWVTVTPTEVTIPVSASSSDYTVVLARINVPMGMQNATHNILIIATSAGNTSVNKSLVLTLVVKQTYEVSISSSAPSLPAAYPSSEVTFTVDVTNTGDGLDIVDLFKSGNFAQHASLSTSSLLLNPGQTAKVNVTVTIPADAKVGTYHVNISAVSRGNGTKYSNITLLPSVAQVYGVSVVCTASTSIGEPGGFSNFSVTIKNLGNGPDSFDVVALNAHLGWSTRVLNSTGVEISNVALASGEQTNLKVSVLVPSSVSNGDYTTIVNATSTGSPTKYSYTVLHTTINLIYSVSLTNVPPSQCMPGNSVVYYITVKNNGNIRDTVNIALTGGNISWASLDNTSVTLNPGETKQIALTFTVPAGTPNNDYTVEVTATSVGNSSAKSTVVIRTTVLVNYGIEITPVGGVTSQVCAPGNYVDFQLRVNNTSDVGANVQITLIGVSETGDTTATLPGGVDTLYANSHTSVLFTVRISAGANAESKNAIYKVIVTLVGVPQPVSSYVNLTAIVQRLYDIDASCAQTQQYAGLGDVIYYTVSVQNKGNVYDTNVVVSINNDPASWASIEGASIFSLAPNEVRDVRVRVSVPSNWQNSINYQFIVNVSGSGNRNDMVTLTTIVSFSSKISSSKNSTNLNPGASERLNFTVTNLGSGNDTILLKAQASTDILTWITLDTSSVTLSKGESANVYFTLTVPSGQPEGKYYFKIVATSLWDSSRTSTQDYSVNVNKVTSIELSSALLVKESLPGTDLTYTFTVQNTGNGVSMVSPITVVAPEGWSATLSTSAFTINQGEQKTVTLTVTIPQNELVGSKTITVTAIADAGANQNTKSITFTANVKQSSKISVAVSEPSLTIEPGSNGANTITIRNNGNGPEAVNITVSMAKDWLVRDFETSFMVPVGESRTIELKFNIPSDLTEARADEYSVNITVKYANNEKSVTSACKIVVPPVYRLVLSSDSYSKTQNVDDRTDVQYTIYVTNMGNDRDLVTMQADMPSGLSTYSFIPNQQAIEPMQTIEVVLKIPYSAISTLLVSDQPHPITVSAKSIDQKLSNSVRFNLSVKSAELNVLSSQITYSKNTILKDGTVTVTAEIRNDGGATAKNVVVRFYDVYETDGTWNENLIGSTTIPSIGVNSVQTTSIEWTVTEIGNHKVKVKLEGAEAVSTSILTVKEPEKGIFDQLSSPALMIGLVIGLGIGMILLIGARGGAKPKIKEEVISQPEQKASAQKKEEPVEKTASEDSETIKVGKEESKEELTSTKIARVKCPKCGEIKDVTSPVRPIEVKCDKCGTKMRLKH